MLQLYVHESDRGANLDKMVSAWVREGLVQITPDKHLLFFGHGQWIDPNSISQNNIEIELNDIGSPHITVPDTST